jgi:hypothetical protein
MPVHIAKRLKRTGWAGRKVLRSDSKEHRKPHKHARRRRQYFSVAYDIEMQCPGNVIAL